MRKWFIIGGVVLILAIGLPVAWYLGSPLFTNNTVQEEFPSVLAGSASAAPSGAPIPAASPPAAGSSAAPATRTAAAPAASAAASPSGNVVSATPSAQPAASASAAPAAAAGPVAVRSGQFHAVDHESSGTALIVRLPDGKYVLRLENFSVDNGPDLFVYLSVLPDSNDSKSVSSNKFLSVAKLKGNKGNQTYELPADFDPATYNSVVIWCQPFRVNFATAPLK